MKVEDQLRADVPRVAIIADSDLKLHLLQSVLNAAGYKVVVAQQAERIDEALLTQKNVDVWVVELDEESSDGIIDMLFEFAVAPILMGDGVPLQTEPEEHKRWQRRLKDKLKRVAVAGLVSAGDDETNPIIQQAHNLAGEQSNAKHVWVLGASMGGPEAVKSFLDSLPINLPIAFVYAQHIDDQYDDLLAKVLGRNNSHSLSICEENHTLRHGQVTIAPTDHMVRFMPFGKVQHLNEKWQGPFSPCIDQVIEDIAQRYKENSGVIIFSGMSNDGAKGVNVMRQQGGEVWAQQPESCICSSMPDSAVESGCVSLLGTPEEMAQALMEKFAREYVIGEARDSD